MRIKAAGWIGIGVLALGAVVAGVVHLRSTGPGGPPPTLDPRLAAWHPLEEGSAARLEVRWYHGTSIPVVFDRTVESWESVAGHLHARVEWREHMRRKRIQQIEWLRPGVGPTGEAQIVCSQRLVGRALHRLAPPQPVLQTPLTPGTTWSWEGTVDGAPCRATFRVLPLAEQDRYGEVLEVEQTTVLGEGPDQLVSTRVQAYAKGVGLVGEEGSFPVHDGPSKPTDSIKARRSAD